MLKQNLTLTLGERRVTWTIGGPFTPTAILLAHLFLSDMKGEITGPSFNTTNTPNHGRFRFFVL